MKDPLRNPLDPLRDRPGEETELFRAMTGACHGHTTEAVVGAAVNVLVNAVRQSAPSRQQAEQLFDDLMGRTKSLLLEKHYDSVTGRRRSVFPFNQTINAPFVSNRNKH